MIIRFNTCLPYYDSHLALDSGPYALNLISELSCSIVSAALAVAISVMIGRTAAVAVHVGWPVFGDDHLDLEICVPCGFGRHLCCRKVGRFGFGLAGLRSRRGSFYLLIDCFDLVLLYQLVEAANEGPWSLLKLDLG